MGNGPVAMPAVLFMDLRTGHCQCAVQGLPSWAKGGCIHRPHREMTSSCVCLNSPDLTVLVYHMP